MGLGAFIRISAIGTLLSAQFHAAVACTSAGFQLPDHGVSRPVWRLGNALVFSSGLRVNTDGAANSYHPIGTSVGALNTICNGIAVYPSAGRWAGQRVTAKKPLAMPAEERCQTILDTFRASRDHDYSVPATGTIDWYAIASRPAQAAKYRPCIQASGPNKGFFVAQTSGVADPSKDICDPKHWISSTEIPYVTLPGERLSAHGVHPGDLALVYRRVQGAEVLVVAVAGDRGNADELGEGSIALHAALGNPQPSHGLPGNIAGNVTTILFAGDRAAQPISRASLEQQKQRLLAAAGGLAAIRSCNPN